MLQKGKLRPLDIISSILLIYRPDDRLSWPSFLRTKLFPGIPMGTPLTGELNARG